MFCEAFDCVDIEPLGVSGKSTKFHVIDHFLS
jgi:hypothetical protein